MLAADIYPAEARWGGGAEPDDNISPHGTSCDLARDKKGIIFL